MLVPETTGAVLKVSRFCVFALVVSGSLLLVGLRTTIEASSTRTRSAAVCVLHLDLIFPPMYVMWFG